MMNAPAIKNYEIRELIAAGGMATVYKAIQVSLDRTVALKVLHVHLAHDENFITRFEREAKAAANLNHENIVNIIDYGENEGIYYIAMEYVEGKSLESIIAAHKSIPLVTALSIAYEICLGLEHAHQKGVVHRDIKPANIIINDHGIPKIADFGVAQAQNSTTLTITGSMVGTPAYMSPEQADGRRVDQRSDLFSLGVLLYEMIAGMRPFRGDSYTVLICEILSSTPAPLHEINPAVPPEIVAIVGKMLEKDPDKRYASAAEAGRDILSYFRKIKYTPARNDIARLVAATDSGPRRRGENGISPPDDRSKVKDRKPAAAHGKNRLRALGIAAAAFAAGSAVFLLVFLAAAGKRKTTETPFVNAATPSGRPARSDRVPAGTPAPGPAREISRGDTGIPAVRNEKETLSGKLGRTREKAVSRIMRKTKAGQSGASYLKIKVEPWAEIYIGKNYIETTPVARPLRVPSGEQELVLQNPNFNSWRKTIDFKPGDTLDLDIALEPLGGSLKLVVKPWADVYIDGKFYETTPIAEPIKLNAGKHMIKCINPTFRIHEEQVDVFANKVTKINIELQPK